MTSLRRSIEKSARSVALCLGLAASLLGLSAVPASAAPSFGVELIRDETVWPNHPIIHRGDQRTDYTIRVENTASADVAAGDTLTCDPTSVSGTGSPVHSFEWRRNGQLISGETSQTYVVSSPADDGALIQCQVTATNTVPDANSGGFAAMTQTTVPGLVVNPQPSLDPPVPPTSTLTLPTPANPIAGTVVTCPSFGTWQGVTEPFEYQWYVNGVIVPGENASTYTAQAGDIPGEIQCAVTGSNGETAVTRFSGRRPTSPAPNPRASNFSNGGSVVHPSATTGPVTVELELPGGVETFARRINNESIGGTDKGIPPTSFSGWSCSAQLPAGLQPAKATCTRSDQLSPGDVYPPIVVQAALGNDAPDLAVAQATVSGGGVSSPANASDEFLFEPFKGFGIEAFDAGVEDEAESSYTQAGGHPFVAKAAFAFNGRRSFQHALSAEFSKYPFAIIDAAKTIRTETPRGFVGNALAIEELCPTMGHVFEGECPAESSVAGIDLYVGLGVSFQKLPIYAVEPEFGRPAQFAFTTPNGGIYVFYPTLRADDGYAITFESAPGPSGNFGKVALAEVAICGFGANLTSIGGTAVFDSCRQATDANANPKPLITNPTRCVGDPPKVTLHANSWSNPDIFKSETITDPMPTNCEAVPFEPTMEFKPTSNQADSPTGLDIELEMPTEGLESPTGISQANLKKAKITFPEGMGVNAAAGHGLGACSVDQVGLGTNDPIACPDSSKIGTIEIETPIIQETLKGAIYVAKQGEVNGSLIGLYLVFESKKDGIIIKLAGTVKPDPVTGQLVSTFDESVEAPFSRVAIKFAQGPRSPLITPSRCGKYDIVAEFTPWSVADFENPDPADLVTDASSFEVTEGPNGGPCPTDALDPKLNAGTTNPIAGETSPFVMRLHRDDGTQRFAGLELAPPLGLTAYLRGVPYCPDATLASISGAPQTGQAQIDNPSCPAASLVGQAQAGAGAGANPLYVNTGKVYLAGPYKGAPVSLAVVTPAVAGPLDLGNVVIRTALHVDSVSAQIRAISDPIPTILHGILLDVRDIRVQIDRAGFTLNPTSCEEKSLSATVKGAKGLSANEPGDSVDVSNRFQVADCAALDFKPRVNLRLFGGTTRAKYQGVRAVVRPRPGDANISGAVVKFPTSAFVAQEHLQNICTRVQWAAEACPKNSVYGRAIAWSPLLDVPLRGNVHLRSSNNLLPDLVADLRGPAHQPIKVEVAIKTDAVKGALRSTVMSAPDAPVSFFRLQTFGGKKGLIVNSRNICRGKNLARAGFRAHNGRRSVQAVPARNAKCGKQRKAQRRKAAKRKRMAAAKRRAAQRRG